MKKKLTEKDFNDLYNQVEEEIQYVDVKPYSHNIISIGLRQVDEKYGKEKVIEIFNDFNLEEYGWTRPTL